MYFPREHALLIIILLELVSITSVTSQQGSSNSTNESPVVQLQKIVAANSALEERLRKLAWSDLSAKATKIYIKNDCLRPRSITHDQGFLYYCSNLVQKSPSKRVLVTGGAGFVGSHLVDSLMLQGHNVTVCDNFDSGRLQNIEHWLDHPRFKLLKQDVVVPLNLSVDMIYHLASPASPSHYMTDPIKTIRTITIGALNMLELAKREGAKIVIASTSEVYGDPKVHPQQEIYWGNVNPIGPRSCYDESKRLSESLAAAYSSGEKVFAGVARIFNTYGPRMHPKDGRVISNFITQVLRNESITIYGSGEQTRSFQYISDLIEGLEKLMNSNVTSPVNLGNPAETSIISLAKRIQSKVPSTSSSFAYKTLPVDDPHRRQPDIGKAVSALNWSPEVNLDGGLERTIEYFKEELGIEP